MNILFVTARFPYPLLRGDQIVSFHRLRVLSEKHDITLLTFYEDEQELDGLKYIEPFCKKIELVKHSKVQSFFGILINLFSEKPLQVAYFDSILFKKKLLNLIQNNTFDLAHVFMLRISPFFFDIKTPQIIELIDSMVLNFSRRLEKSSGFKKILFIEELRRLKNFEPLMSKIFDEIVVVSNIDKQYITSENVHSIPLGVDLERFYPKTDFRITQTIVFSGNMSYSPNVEAIYWFMDNCWSIVYETNPSVECWIVGNNPSSRVTALSALPNVRVLGRVDSIADVLRDSMVAIAPMQSGSGMQFKILEAMACGLPVVTTTLGLGSIQAQDGIELLVADQPKDFAAKVLMLLQNPDQSIEIGESAQKFIKQNHSWESGASHIETLYASALAKHNRN